jgi:diguanylate cyclase (GGDEF)-like protein
MTCRSDFFQIRPTADNDSMILKSLTFKLALAVVLLVLLPSVLLSAYLYEREHSAAIDAEYRRMQSYSKEIANEIDAFIVSHSNITRYSVVSTELRGVFRKDLKNVETRLELSEWLTHWAGISNNIAEVFLLNHSGECVASTDKTFIGENYSIRPYFQDAIQGTHHVSDWSVGITSKKPGIYLSSPILSNENKVVGVLVVKLDPEPIDTIIRRSKNLGMQTFLVNRDGVLLAHYEPALRYALIDDLTEKSSAAISKTRQFADLPQTSLKLSSLSEDLLGARPGEAVMSRKYEFQGQVKVAALTGSQSRHWVVGVTVPLSSVALPAKQRVYGLLPMMLLVLLFTAAASIYILRSVVRPLRELVQKAKQISSGDYSALANTKGDDEVSQLAHSFNDMAKEIRSYTDDLESRVTKRTEELEKANEEIRQLSITDPLTGCFNRRYMDEHLALSLEQAKRFRRNLSISICDIDFFKKVNDQWGHLAGDRVLSEVGQTLRRSLRKSDWIARYGGEEFMVVLPETECSDAHAVMEKLRGHLEEMQIPFNGNMLRITASFGLASLESEKDESVMDLVGRADTYLYQAKGTGRNRVVSQIPAAT